MSLIDAVVIFGSLVVVALAWIALCLKRINDNLAGLWDVFRLINNNLAARADLAAGEDPKKVRERVHGF